MIFTDNTPIYIQITEKIMDDIMAEVYPAEGRLPSVREYGASIEVNANTVMRSYDWLQQQHIIFNKRGIGYFVLPEAKKRILEMRKHQFFNKESDTIFSRMASIGLTPDELKNLYEDYLTTHSPTPPHPA